MSRKILYMLSILVLIAMALVACGGEAATEEPVATEAPVETEVMEEPTQPPAEPEATEEMMEGSTIQLPEVDPSTVTGDIIEAGSSTVFPLAEAIAKRFESEGYSGKITIDSIGSGAGFERFCVAGETDISNASRAIRDSEIESCGQLTPPRTPIEFRVGTDAISVVVNQDNDFLSDMTLEELALAFSADVTTWSEIRSDWPAEDIQCFSPGTDSGTFDFFIEEVMTPAYGDDEDAAKNAILNNQKCQFSEDDNVLVQGVLGSPYAIGYFGFAYYNENQDILTAVSLNGIAPNAESAESGEYPLARPLFIYSDAGIMQAKPQVASFINFFLTYVNDEILDVGYFPASGEALDAAKQAWLDAMGQ